VHRGRQPELPHDEEQPLQETLEQPSQEQELSQEEQPVEEPLQQTLEQPLQPTREELPLEAEELSDPLQSCRHRS